MNYYPVNLKIEGGPLSGCRRRSCRETRKVKGLMQCGAGVVVVSQVASLAIERLAAREG